MEPLTKRQREVLDFIAHYVHVHGYAPTLQEIGAALGGRCLATVHAHLTALQAKGHVTRRWNRSRATAVIPPATPHDLAAAFAAGWEAAIEAGCPDRASQMLAARTQWLESRP